jgi:hypothetical protein
VGSFASWAQDDALYLGAVPLNTLAPRCIGLLGDDSWVARRSERIAFASDTVVERCVQVDFAVTTPARVRDDLCAIPLVLLPKNQPAWGFRLIDARDRRVAWPSQSDTVELAVAMIQWYAYETLGQVLPNDVAATLRDVASLPAPEAHELLATSLQPAPSRPQAWLRLGADEAFRRLAEDLARFRVVAVVVALEWGAPSVIELTYRQWLDVRPAGGLSSLFGVVGWRDHAIALEATLPLAADQRIELCAPEEVE